MKPRTIHEAVDQLVQRQRIRLHRDDTGRQEWHTLPSLWEQLQTSTGYSAGAGGNGGYRAQEPISGDVVALIIDIAEATREGAQEHLDKPHDTVPDNLRGIASALTSAPREDDQLDWWTNRITEWSAEARAALRLDPIRPRWARGIACPECGADTARATLNGEAVRTPALAVTWSQPGDDEYHQDRDWMVRAVECRMCGAVWHRGTDLDVLVEQMLTWNTTHQTLAHEA